MLSLVMLSGEKKTSWMGSNYMKTVATWKNVDSIILSEKRTENCIYAMISNVCKLKNVCLRIDTYWKKAWKS